MTSEIDIREFKIEIDGSILSASARPALEKFDRFLDEISSLKGPVGVVLYSGSGMADLSPGFIGELKSDLFFEGLYDHCLLMQRIAFRIQSSPHCFVFVCQEDCLGALFDLALTCDFRFCFNPRARVGFPTIRGGVFPFCGGFTERFASKARGRRKWLQKPMVPALVAQSLGFLDLVAEQGEWLADTRSWLENKLTSGFVKGEHALQKMDEGVGVERVAQFIERELGKYTEWQTPEDRFSNCWNLTKSFSRRPEYYQVLAYLSAKTFVSQEFLKWAQRYLAIAGSRYTKDPGRIKNIYVDMDYLGPPLQPLLRLIDSGYRVVFCTPDEHRLKEGMELMFARFDRSLAKEKALEYWDRGIGWAVSSCGSGEKVPFIRWLANDRVEIQSFDGKLSFLRFAGNRGSAECGWSEIALPVLTDLDEDHESYQIARVMADGIVSSRFLAGGKVELSTYVRSLFLEELLRTSGEVQGGVNRVMPMLKSAGWGYASEENSWEYFLRTREQAYQIPGSSVVVAGISLSDDCWRVGLWREAREIGSPPKGGGSSWNPVFLNQHFACFAGLIASALNEDGLTVDHLEADRFVCECLGFPAAFGTPLGYLETRGDLRTFAYAKEHWPAALAKVISKGVLEHVRN